MFAPETPQNTKTRRPGRCCERVARVTAKPVRRAFRSDRRLNRIHVSR